MMFFLKLANRRSFSMIPTFIPRFFSASAAQTPDPEPKSFSIVDYLVSSFGFSPDKAAMASRTISHIKSPDKPDAARRFLASQGFSDSDIKTLVKLQSNILCISPKKLDANLHALRDIGLSLSALTQVILSDPSTLQLSAAAPRIKFWMDFFAGDEVALVKAFKRNPKLSHYHIDRNISPKLSLLQKLGFSNEYIRKIVHQVNRFITIRVSLMEDVILRAEELGFQPGSRMFPYVLHTMAAVSREEWQRKQDFFLSFGWSEDELVNAVRKAPTFLRKGKKNLQAKMDFLMGEARLETSFIACHPDVLTYSLEKRLRPRLYVLHFLDSKGLSSTRRGFYSVIKMTDNNFVEAYILPFKEEIPGLHEAFLEACAGETTTQFGKLK